MTSELRGSIFSRLHETRNPTLVANTFGIKKAIVDEVSRMEYLRLAKRFSADDQESIYVGAQMNQSEVRRVWEITAAEVHALCSIVHRRALKAKEALAAWLSLHENDRIEFEWNVREGKEQMQDALASARAGSWEAGRYEGELSTSELHSTGKRHSYFRWLYELSLRIPQSIAWHLFGDVASRFRTLCDDSLRNRKQRQREAAKDPSNRRKGRQKAELADPKLYMRGTRSADALASLMIAHCKIAAA
jgi:hypothetical protein